MIMNGKNAQRMIKYCLSFWYWKVCRSDWADGLFLKNADADVEKLMLFAKIVRNQSKLKSQSWTPVCFLKYKRNSVAFIIILCHFPDKRSFINTFRYLKTSLCRFRKPMQWVEIWKMRISIFRNDDRFRPFTSHGNYICRNKDN